MLNLFCMIQKNQANCYIIISYKYSILIAHSVLEKRSDNRAEFKAFLGQVRKKTYYISITDYIINCDFSYLFTVNATIKYEVNG